MFSTEKGIKFFTIFLTVLMAAGIVYSAFSDTGAGYSAGERILAALVGSLIVLLINFLIYKLLLFLKK
ncbi:hypothetical protein SAMN04488137_3034 [Fictibacillus solisalsi]|uniref:Uncharacterized protein n=1 Tax=Fictibacillus solisalsi TaxID=459525 RepID=A0A1G9XVA6_9BACL|nr:hypothetical protein [Fictibacillus solisalsi]SDN00759.1 hypothetical protein SAMN04488137_3034 [Fictibacillus solisalsi]